MYLYTNTYIPLYIPLPVNISFSVIRSVLVFILISFKFHIYLPLATFRIKSGPTYLRSLCKEMLNDCSFIEDVMSGDSVNFKALNGNALLYIKLCANLSVI